MCSADVQVMCVTVSYQTSHPHSIGSSLYVVFSAEPKPPTGMTFTVIGSDSAVVSWTASQSMCDDVVGNYSVRYQLRDGTGANTTVYTNRPSVTLQDLIPNAEYVVLVAAVNSRGDTNAHSVELSFTVSTPTTPMSTPTTAPPTPSSPGPQTGGKTICRCSPCPLMPFLFCSQKSCDGHWLRCSLVVLDWCVTSSPNGSNVQCHI